MASADRGALEIPGHLTMTLVAGVLLFGSGVVVGIALCVLAALLWGAGEEMARRGY